MTINNNQTQATVLYCSEQGESIHVEQEYDDRSVTTRSYRINADGSKTLIGESLCPYPQRHSIFPWVRA